MYDNVHVQIWDLNDRGDVRNIISAIVGRGGALEESKPFDRRVMGSNTVGTLG